jgi:hypothetical protein
VRALTAHTHREQYRVTHEDEQKKLEEIIAYHYVTYRRLGTGTHSLKMCINERWKSNNVISLVLDLDKIPVSNTVGAFNIIDFVRAFTELLRRYVERNDRDCPPSVYFGNMYTCIVLRSDKPGLAVDQPDTMGYHLHWPYLTLHARVCMHTTRYHLSTYIGVG